jgi:hypothetical protein
MHNIIRFFFRAIMFFMLIFLVSCAVFVGIRGNRPMSISQVPAGMTYWEFMQDRLDAAKDVQPARCGTGIITFFAIMAPIYSVLYTHVGIHPDSFLARMTMHDGNIPTGVAEADLTQVPEIWWKTVERLSWSALARRTPACNFRPLKASKSKDPAGESGH